MRVMTKAEILSMDCPLLIREWEPNVYNDVGWLLTSGRDAHGHVFGAVDLDPDPNGEDDDPFSEWDWDGDLDLEDDKVYVVAEKNDLANMIARLQRAMEKCDHEAVSSHGVALNEYNPPKK